MNKLHMIIWFIIFSHFLIGKEYFSKNKFQKPEVVGLNTRVNFNNINLTISNDGSIGHNGDAYFPNGSNLSFLYSGGIGISGYDDNGNLKISWIFPSSRIYEFAPGIRGMDCDDPKAKFYMVDQNDGPGSAHFMDWADAVAMGADFIDNDQNGQYDPMIDKPDLLGQFTIWSVVNDSTSPAGYGFVNGKKVGVEVHQTVFGFYGYYGYGNVLFLRYRIKNVSGQNLNNAMFSFILDPDIGYYNDDLAGCKPELSLGYAYNYSQDDIYGPNPPAVGVDLLQGAIVISPGDTAEMHYGPDKGISFLPDMKNLPMSSFMIMEPGSADLEDPSLPSEGRNFMVGGLYKDGTPIDPMNFYRGTGASNQSDPKFLFDGDPVSGNGWVNNIPSDNRILINNGPFSLTANEEQEIILALMVAQGTDSRNSVEKLFQLDSDVQTLYDVNFDILKLLSLNDNQKNIPYNFRLREPFPNPFNLVVNVPVDISPESSNSKFHIGIYNISGKLVWEKEIIPFQNI